jgi:hypothetical protein
MAAGRLPTIVSTNHVPILNRWKVGSLISRSKGANERVVLPDVESSKDFVINEAESLMTRIIEVSETAHSNPEPGLKEYKASELLSSELQKHGFTVETGIAGMPTAFRATLSSGHGGPHLAYLAEYDALPQIGHACGHNIIGTSAIFSAIIWEGCPRSGTARSRSSGHLMRKEAEARFRS